MENPQKILNVPDFGKPTFGTNFQLSNNNVTFIPISSYYMMSEAVNNNQYPSTMMGSLHVSG